ncbi:kinase-like domain-containing protein [Mycena vulgaris]|nr:kinase-like domain-containing protein [Mycena vulgaris]
MNTDAHAARTAALRERLKLPPAGSSRNDVPVPGTQLNTAILLHHEHGGGLPGEAKTMVCWQVRCRTSYIDSDLGSAFKLWANSLFLNDIKSDILQSINIEWTRSTPIPLSDQDTSFRWCGGRLLERNTSTLTLGEFYLHHSTPSNAPIYLHNVPTMFKHYLKTAKTQPFICLEMYIDPKAWAAHSEDIVNRENHSEDLDDYFPALRSTTTCGNRKRTRTESTASTSSAGNKAKQPRSIVQKRSDITFKKITCITTVATGQTTLVDTDEIYQGHISDQPFASGTMKYAYDLQLVNGDQYVAKRFFKLSAGDSDDSVSVEDNRIQIEGELIRLALGKWFLDAFYRFCKSYKDSVCVYLDIEFADAFLAMEKDRASTASNVPIITSEDDGLTWLIERKRPSAVIKFSGTLVHRSVRKDIRSATIAAFSHFVFGYGKGDIVFADIQGTPCQLKTKDGLGKDGLVLFDVMTHTSEGCSGIGDFGIQGIETFVKDHQCNEICRGLMLHEIYPLVAEKNGQNTGNTSDGEGDGDDGDQSEEDTLAVYN